MTIKPGDRLPDATLNEFYDVEGNGCSLGPNSFKVADLVKGKKIVIFGLPGAYTPTCSAKHVPSYLQNFDKSAMVNNYKNLVPSLANPPFDPNRDYSMPWQTGMTGLVVRSDLAPDVTSICDLFDSQYAGKVEMLTEMRDTMLFLLLMEGSDPEDFTDDEFTAAIERLKGIVESGAVRRFAGNDYVDDMKSGDIVACEAWSGDVINLLGGGDGAHVIGQNSNEVSSYDPKENILMAIVDWVEKGNAPETIIGTKFVNDTQSLGVEFQRAHCKYPKRNQYKGEGDPNVIGSWECVDI